MSCPSSGLRALASVGVVATLVIGVGLASGPSSADAAKKQKRKATPTPMGTAYAHSPRHQIPPGLRDGTARLELRHHAVPGAAWWVDSIGSMASRFPASTREQLAVVVEVSGGGGRGNCWAHFPQPATGTYPNVNWDDTDLFESTFDAFDAAGIKVWLQVEPARCDVPMLIDLLYQQYGHHPSVIGFGVDVEWYRKDISRTGKPITDAEAAAWVAQVRTQGRGPSRPGQALADREDAADAARRSRLRGRQPGPRLARQHGRRVQRVGRGLRAGAGRLPVRLPERQAVVERLSDPPRDIGNALLQEPEHAGPALGRLHRLRHLATAVGRRPNQKAGRHARPS